MIFQACLREFVRCELCQFFGCQMERVEGKVRACPCLFRFHSCFLLYCLPVSASLLEHALGSKPSSSFSPIGACLLVESSKDLLILHAYLKQFLLAGGVAR